GEVARLIGRPELAEDPRFATNAARVGHHEEMMRELEAGLGSADVADWTERLRAAAVPAGQVHDIGEAIARAESYGLDPVTDVGPGHPAQVRHPVRYSGFTPVHPAPPPALDEHGDALRAWLDG